LEVCKLSPTQAESTGIDLRGFVHDSFKAMNAEVVDLSAGLGIWGAKVNDNQARYLGRANQDQILFTFDLNRWDDGSKLECLTQVSPLVRRLQDYAVTRGSTLIAHVPVQTLAQKSAGYQSYLLARFDANFDSASPRQISRWLGLNLTTGSLINVKGDPMLTPGLVEGLPDKLTHSEIAYNRVPDALQMLADQWNEIVRLDTQRAHNESQRLFTVQAQEVYEATTGTAREKAIKQLRKQHEMTVECELTMGLVLVLPTKSG